MIPRLKVGGSMRRREFFGVLGGVVAWPGVVRGQQPAVLRVGKAGREAFSFVPVDVFIALDMTRGSLTEE